MRYIWKILISEVVIGVGMVAQKMLFHVMRNPNLTGARKGPRFNKKPYKGPKGGRK